MLCGRCSENCRLASRAFCGRSPSGLRKDSQDVALGLQPNQAWPPELLRAARRGRADDEQRSQCHVLAMSAVLRIQETASGPAPDRTIQENPAFRPTSRCGFLPNARRQTGSCVNISRWIYSHTFDTVSWSALEKLASGEASASQNVDGVKPLRGNGHSG